MEPEISTGAKTRFFALLDNAESIYLVILRAAILIIATICLIWALWLTTSGLFGISRDAASVQEIEANVSAQEVASAPLDVTAGKAGPKDPLAAERAYYSDFAKRYLALFRARFEVYRQPSDAAISLQQFDTRFLQSASRLQAITDGNLIFADDKRDLESLLATMREAATLPAATHRLRLYKTSRRQRVERKVNGTRTESYCSYYGYYIGTCITYATRQVPYTETRVSMELPKGVIPYDQLFGKYQDAYFSLLTERREANRRHASDQRAEIVDGNLRGRISLWTAVQVLGSFLVLMFFFLLIAIERHQRKLSARLAPDKSTQPGLPPATASPA
jgi:hypothetical protein